MPNHWSRYWPTKPVAAERQQQRDAADHRRQHQRQRHQRAQQPQAGEPARASTQASGTPSTQRDRGREGRGPQRQPQRLA